MVSILQGSALSVADMSVGTAVDRVMMSWVDASPSLTERAQCLRGISGDAETEMERYFSSQWLAWLERGSNRAETLTDIVTRFPYYEGYRELVAAESTLLDEPKRVVFGGGGPLPISGLLLASLTGAQVVLVDADEEAVARSARLVRALERRELIQRDQVVLRHQDLADVSLEDAEDGIIVASLVDSATKIRLAQRLSRYRDSIPLILRSAIGMCARLAYHRAPRQAVVAAGLHFRGELVPANHVVPSVDSEVASQFDVRSEQGGELLGVLSSSVLNSVELYAAYRDAE